MVIALALAITVTAMEEELCKKWTMATMTMMGKEVWDAMTTAVKGHPIVSARYPPAPSLPLPMALPLALLPLFLTTTVTSQSSPSFVTSFTMPAIIYF